MVKYDFSGKTAFITGGSSGIGKATASAFGKAGANVVVAARREEQGKAVADEIKSGGGKALFIKTDVTDDTSLKAAVNGTVAEFGSLDIAFNNAGVDEQPVVFHEQTEDVYDRVMTVNVKGVWRAMQYELPHLLKNKGAIINNASVLGVAAVEGIAVYCASKFAVVGLTKAAALEYAKQGVRINALCPAASETDLFQHVAADSAVREFLVGKHPIGRVSQPEEQAAAVLWLASEDASFVTGTALTVDGGWSAQ